MNDNQNRSSGDIRWTAEQNNALRVLQVAELYSFAPVATLSSYFGAFLVLGVLIDTGDTERGLYWFAFATAVTLYRLAVIGAYQHRGVSAATPELWARLMISGNLFAGIQWGILGTVLFPDAPGYRELFTLMVITCYVGGSVTSYAAVKWAHPALALPAAIPPVVYLFFVRDGVHLYAGIAALFFCLAIVYYALKLNRHIEHYLRLIIENRDLLAHTSNANHTLTRENRDLAHRAEVRRRLVQVARDEAHINAAHFAHTPIPMAECDAEYRLLSWNEAAGKLFGYTLDEAHGKSLATLLLPAERHEKAMVVMRQLLVDRQPISLKGHAVTKTGKLLCCACHLTPVVPNGGGPLRIAMIVSHVEDLGNFRQVA